MPCGLCFNLSKAQVLLFDSGTVASVATTRTLFPDDTKTPALAEPE